MSSVHSIKVGRISRSSHRHWSRHRSTYPVMYLDREVLNITSLHCTVMYLDRDREVSSPPGPAGYWYWQDGEVLNTTACVTLRSVVTLHDNTGRRHASLSPPS